MDLTTRNVKRQETMPGKLKVWQVASRDCDMRNSADCPMYGRQQQGGLSVPVRVHESIQRDEFVRFCRASSSLAVLASQYSAVALVDEVLNAPH